MWKPKSSSADAIPLARLASGDDRVSPAERPSPRRKVAPRGRPFPLLWVATGGSVIWMFLIVVIAFYAMGQEPPTRPRQVAQADGAIVIADPKQAPGPNIADVLTEAGISWRIYQDMNNNWTGAMNGFLAFESFRTAQPGSTIYVNGMTTWTIADLQTAVQNNTLATVNWVLPSAAESEHPGAPCSPTHGGYFAETVLEALTANPAVWASTIFILDFDENDGYFDHIPNPAVPSYDASGTLQGKTTMPTEGLYFNNATRTYSGGSYLSGSDTISGNLRPWGLGARIQAGATTNRVRQAARRSACCRQT